MAATKINHTIVVSNNLINFTKYLFSTMSHATSNVVSTEVTFIYF